MGETRVSRKSHQQAGLAGIQAVIAIGVMMLAGAGLLNLTQALTKTQKATSVIASRKSLEDSVSQHLEDYEAARMTVQATPALGNALINGCTGAQGGAANIRTRSNSVFAPQNFDMRMQVCTTNCPFQLLGRWGCQANVFWMDVTTRYQPNLDLPGFDTRGGTVVTRVDLDRNFWRSAAQTVRWGSLCAPDTQVLRGLLPNGMPDCEDRVRPTQNTRVPGQYCPPGRVVVGISNRGAPVCEEAANQLGIQVCVQMSDRGCSSQVGQEECTPCLSTMNMQQGQAYYGPWASDANRYDPDCSRVSIRRCGTAPSGGTGSSQTAQQEALENAGQISNIRFYTTPCTDSGTTIRVRAGFCALSRVTAWTFGFHDTNDTNCIISPAGTNRWQLHARCHDIDIGNADPCAMVCHD